MESGEGRKVGEGASGGLSCVGGGCIVRPLMHSPPDRFNPSHTTPRSCQARAPRPAAVPCPKIQPAARLILAALTLTTALTPAYAYNQTQPATPQPPPTTTTQQATPPVSDPLAAFEGRLVREVTLVGVDDPGTRQLAENLILTRPGRPLRLDTVRADIINLNRTGRFQSIDANVEPFADQTVKLRYVVRPALIIRDVQAIGNRQIPDDQLARLVDVAKDTPADDFQLDQLARRIERFYRDKGYFLAEVSVDRSELESDGIVIFRIREGTRMRVADIRFRGNESFRTALIRNQANIRTRTSGLFETGPVERLVLEQDAAAIVSFYRDRGFLDARADYERVESSDKTEAIITFIIDEGDLYTVRSVRAVQASPLGDATDQPLEIFDDRQIAGLVPTKAGSIASERDIRRAADVIRDAYRKLGYVDARVVNTIQGRDAEKPVIDIVFVVSPGERYLMGITDVVGNDITQTKIPLRNFRTLPPDRPFDATQIPVAERRIRESQLFDPRSVRLTIQPEDPLNPHYRDLLVELEETNTGSITFGVGVNSDAGVAGIFGIEQRNFDIADPPDSFGEFITGRAFRGAGQTFNITLSPGTETQNYSISLTEPAIFDSDYSVTVSGAFNTRKFRDYDVQRLGSSLRVGRVFGERWTVAAQHRIDNTDLRNITASAPTDIFDFEGDTLLHSVGLFLTRTSADTRVRPTRGARTELGVEYFGLAGDREFTRLSAQHIVFLPVYETFLGRTTVLTLKTSVGYIPEGREEVPPFERLYLGGRTFRGFRFQTISPKGVRNDNGEFTNRPTGGAFSFFSGAELDHPIYEDILSLAFFVDTGTVTTDPSFDDYRVSAGVGLRLLVPAISPVPFAFDFGFPIVKQFGDEERVFSFSFDIPF